MYRDNLEIVYHDIFIYHDYRGITRIKCYLLGSGEKDYLHTYVTYMHFYILGKRDSSSTLCITNASVVQVKTHNHFPHVEVYKNPH